MARTDSLTNFLTDVSTAIKEKKGDNTPIKASNFDTEIANLPTGSGGVDISEYIDTSTNSTSAGTAISSGVWSYLVKKLPPITKLNPNSAYFFNGFRGSELDLSQVPSNTKFTDTRGMFQSCLVTSLDLSHLNFDNVTKADGMFQSCSASVLNLGNNTFPNNTSFSNMLNGTKIEQLFNFDYGKATTLNQYLYSCSKLQGEINIDAPLCSNFNGTFRVCSLITKIKVSTQVTKNLNLSYMCYGCTSLKTLDLSEIDMQGVTGVASYGMVSMFYNCKELENLIFGTNCGMGFSSSLSANFNYATIDLKESSKLTKASVLDLFNKVADITGKKTQKIILHADVKAQLTDEEIAIATNKGWTVA